VLSSLSHVPVGLHRILLHVEHTTHLILDQELSAQLARHDEQKLQLEEMFQEKSRILARTEGILEGARAEVAALQVRVRAV